MSHPAQVRILPPFGDGVTVRPVREVQHITPEGAIVPDPTGEVQYLVEDGTPDGCAYASRYVEAAP
jgi:hypothetical protein